MTRLWASLCVPVLAGAVAGAQAPARYEVALSGIFRIRPDGTQSRLLARVTSAVLLPNAWSPDGRTIVVWGGGPGLTLVDATTGSTRSILNNIGVEPFIAWSPDSTRIAFSSAFEAVMSSGGAPARGQLPDTAVYTVDIATGESKRESPFGQNRFVSWSPDGAHIAYAGTESGSTKYDIYVVDVATLAVRRITETTTINVEPAWSPRGDELAYVAAPRSPALTDQSGVFVVRGDGTAPRRISPVLAQSVTWSPDARFVLVRSATNPIVDVSSGTTVAEVGAGLDATFTPDGRSVVYRIADAPPYGGVYVIEADATNRRKLADSPFFAVSPLLTP